MDPKELQEALSALGLEPVFLQREIKRLGWKRVTKRDPYDVLHSVLLHLYCVGDKERFTALFTRFFSSDMESHLAQNFNLWCFVEYCILLYSDLTGDTTHDHCIPDKGFVADRLEGSMLELNSRNLRVELGEFEKGHDLPRETIVRRYQSLITECLLIIRFKEPGLFRSHKATKSRLQRYRKLYLAMVGHFDEPDEQIIAALRTVSDEIA